MKNIRQKVFETNSSSSHSISIEAGQDGLYDTIIPDSDGVILLDGGEFGWAWDKFNDALTKANYAAEYAKDHEEMTELLVSVIKEHTGAKDVDVNPQGYIDHQSDRCEGGECMRAFTSPQSLKDWIFNPKSWLFTGNDNDSAPANFYDPPGTVYKYELSLRNSSVKFKSYPSNEELTEELYNLFSEIRGSEFRFRDGVTVLFRNDGNEETSSVSDKLLAENKIRVYYYSYDLKKDIKHADLTFSIKEL